MHTVDRHKNHKPTEDLDLLRELIPAEILAYLDTLTPTYQQVLVSRLQSLVHKQKRAKRLASKKEYLSE
jgi:hypothetical protein